MAKYLTQDGSLKSQGEIRQLYPNVSLPRVWNQDTLDFLGITPVFDTPKPTTDDLTKQYVQDGTEIDAKGNTVIKWTLVDKFSDYTDSEGTLVTKAEQEANYLETLKEQKKQAMKQARQTAINGTHTVTVPSGSYEIDVDSNSRSNIHQTIDNAELAGLTDGDSTVWKMADNKFYSVTYGELKLIGLQMAQYIQSQYATEAIKNAEIDAATLLTIEGITWES